MIFYHYASIFYHNPLPPKCGERALRKRFLKDNELFIPLAIAVEGYFAYILSGFIKSVHFV